MNKTAVVLVSYNRAELLRECLDALAAQTHALDAVVVVDNASTDNSAEVAKTHPATTDFLRLEKNTGGAGGFAAGMAFALDRYPQLQWLWLMDDDTIPSANCLSELLQAADRYPGKPALLASEALWVDGRVHPMNTPRTRRLLSKRFHLAAQKAGARQIRTASFVSLLVEAQAVRRLGLPRAAYFLWNDDFEFTARLLRKRVGLYVPAAQVEHKTKKFGASETDPGERFRFEVRNKLWTYLRHMPFNALEAPLYVGATLRRWAITVRRSKDRKTLLKAAKTGLKEGLRKHRSTFEVLADTPVAFAVMSLER